MRFCKKAYLALWMLLLLTLGGYYLFFAPRDGAYSPEENRTLTGFPAFTAENVFDGSFGEEMEQYLLDHFPGRNRVITQVNRLENALSMASHEDYLRITQGVEDPLVNNDIQEDLEALLQEIATQPTVRPTEPPATEPAVPGETVPVENPPIEPKPPAAAEDFPAMMGLYIDYGSQPHYQLMQYSRDSVVAVTAVLNKYAAILPENGKLLFTVCPGSYLMQLYESQENKRTIYYTWDEAVNALSSDNVYAFDTAEILAEAIRDGEYVTYRTDNHWTSYGAWLVYTHMASRAGKELCRYPDDFTVTTETFKGTYFRDDPSAYWGVEADTLTMLMPRIPVENRRITGPDQYEVIDFLNMDANPQDRYTVFLSGPGGPWRYVVCDNDQTENCLVITDSFGLSFIPFLTGNYKEIHYYDPRFYDRDVVGCTVAEMIEENEIQDIYVIVADFHSFISSFLIGDANKNLYG